MSERKTHKNYFTQSVICLLTVLFAMFCGCRQTSHIEKDKYEFEPTIEDSTLVDSLRLPERIIDTITLGFDSIPADTVPLYATDSLMQLDSLSRPMDSLTPMDSLPQDTVKHTSRGRITPRRSESAIETQVICSASDSVYRDMNLKKVFYFGNAEAKYDDISLKADYLEFDLETSTCKARGTLDSLGKLQGRPVFKQGESTFEAEEMLYNFRTKKGIITKVWTTESDGYLHGQRVKRMDDNSINIKSGGYTTCNLKEHPHYQFKFTKAKVIPDDKIVTGPIYLTVEDVPLPLALPFAMIPNTKGKKSGLIIPTYGESDNRGFYLENGG